MDKFCTQCGQHLSVEALFCTNCGHQVSVAADKEEQLSRKREVVMGRKGKPTFDYSRKVVLPLFVVGASLWLYANLPDSGNPILKESPVITAPATYAPSGVHMQEIPVAVEDGYVVIPLDVVRDKKFVRFMYGDPTYGIPMLSYISPEGKVVTAVSMCEPCNSTAFHLKGEALVCNSCGTTWVSGTMEAISGSCGKYPPDVVPNEVSDGRIRVDERYISTWQRRI